MISHFHVVVAECSESVDVAEDYGAVVGVEVEPLKAEALAPSSFKKQYNTKFNKKHH